jgi:hypothetical protein
MKIYRIIFLNYLQFFYWINDIKGGQKRTVIWNTNLFLAILFSLNLYSVVNLFDKLFDKKIDIFADKYIYWQAVLYILISYGLHQFFFGNEGKNVELVKWYKNQRDFIKKIGIIISILYLLFTVLLMVLPRQIFGS